MKNLLAKGFKISNNSIKKIVKHGLNYAFIVCLIATFVLLTYKFYYISYDLYEISLVVFQAGLIFAIQFIVCGFVFDKLLT